ncbi:putative ornithine aminotransferase [Stachybotrys elegans]|uniref:Ornithine aminotransferase n=1 Tax=Stachybotrys elegans TaxID=80388 RepID=A0A8K0SHE8_9HYPO|nr:putative ornithine aminotransferase [Stachybotrys elegans]
MPFEVASTTVVEPRAAALSLNGPAKTMQTALAPVDSSLQLTAVDYIQCEDVYSLKGMAAHPVVMERGQGEFLWDTTGKRYIDFNAGFSSCNQGHCHPKIVKAMMEQCQVLALPSRSVHNANYALLCKKLCHLSGFDKVALLNGGAEAVDMAIKAARAWAYKVKGIAQDQCLVLTAEHNYHGRSLSLLSASNDAGYRKNCGPWMPNVGPYCTGAVIRFGVVEDLEKAFKTHGDRIAAYIVEPVQGHAGCIAASDEYLVAVRDLCNKYRILFIADEIQGGLGRAGSLFSYQSSGVKPDMVVLGKSLSGGLYPVSGIIGTEDAMSGLEAGQYGSTFSGNPIGSAVALAALDVIVDEDLPGRSRDLGAKFAARLEAIKSPYFDKITGKGLFRSMYIHETHPEGRVTGARLAALCLERGLLLNSAGRRLRICPALVIDEAIMLEGVDIIERALNDLSDMELP